jgi:hypothetical protein
MVGDAVDLRAILGKAGDHIRRIPVAAIHVEAGELALRGDDSGPDLEDLVRSIQNNGLLEPLLVEAGESRGGIASFLLVDGRRRLLAVRQLQTETVAARVLPRLSPLVRRLLQVATNLHRKDTSPVELAITMADLAKGRLGTAVAPTYLQEQFQLSPESMRRYLRIGEWLIEASAADRFALRGLSLRKLYALRTQSDSATTFLRQTLEAAEEILAPSGSHDWAERREAETSVPENTSAPRTKKLKTPGGAPRKRAFDETSPKISSRGTNRYYQLRVSTKLAAVDPTAFHKACVDWMQRMMADLDTVTRSAVAMSRRTPKGASPVDHLPTLRDALSLAGPSGTPPSPPPSAVTLALRPGGPLDRRPGRVMSPILDDERDDPAFQHEVEQEFAP